MCTATAWATISARTDQSYIDNEGRQSRLTLLLHLDDGCVGGETVLLELENADKSRGIAITPLAGRALWFQHALVHEGRRVSAGVKHILRTDVIYE